MIEKSAKPTHVSKAFSRASADIEITLATKLAARSFKRHFQQLDSAFYVSTKVLREQGRDEEASQVEKRIQSLLVAFDTELTQALEKFQEMVKNKRSSLVVGAVTFDGAEKLKAMVSTGFSVRLIQQFVALDECLAKLQELELLGAISPEDCTALSRSWFGRHRNALQALRDACTKKTISDDKEVTK